MATRSHDGRGEGQGGRDERRDGRGKGQNGRGEGQDGQGEGQDGRDEGEGQDGRGEGEEERRDDGRRDGRPARQAVFEDLFAFLARARSGAHPDRMATRLLRRTGDGTWLVALVEGGRQAVFHDGHSGALRAVPFDEHGPAEEAAVRLLSEAGPATWVARNGAAVAWVHPRYRSADRG